MQSESGAEQTTAELADLAHSIGGRLVENGLADPLGMLSSAARLERLSRTLAEQAAAAAISAGMSWRDVGEAYGISKQAAHQRFARHVRRTSRPPATNQERNSP